MKLLFMALLALSSYTVRADDIPSNIPQQAISEFKKTFKEATGTEWLRLGDMFRVKFNYNAQLLYAFYNEEGQRICMGRTLPLNQLPLLLHVRFQNAFTDYQVMNVFEVSCDDGIYYYITIAKDHKKIILRSEGYGSWVVYSKTKIKSINSH